MPSFRVLRLQEGISAVRSEILSADRSGKETKLMSKNAGMLTGAVCWILGLALTIIGLNVKTDTGTWMTVIGQILFLAGLMIEGVIWFRRKKEK